MSNSKKKFLNYHVKYIIISYLYYYYWYNMSDINNNNQFRILKKIENIIFFIREDKIK
jgi:hypothetical protein